MIERTEDRRAFMRDTLTAQSKTIHVVLMVICSLEIAGCMTPLQKLFVRAEESLHRSEFMRAESLWSTYLEHEPADVDAWYNRALARAGHSDLQGAMKDLDTTLRLWPGDMDARWMRFRIREQQIAVLRADTSMEPLARPARGSWISALAVIQIEELTALLWLDPADIVARCERGILFRKAGRYTDAFADLNIVLRDVPSDVRARTERGNTFHALGCYDDALKDYDVALSECDTCRWLLYNKALSLHAAGRLIETIAVLETLVAADGMDGDAWFMLGDCRLALGRRGAACIAWQKSLDLGIDEAQARLDAYCQSP